MKLYENLIDKDALLDRRTIHKKDKHIVTFDDVFSEEQCKDMIERYENTLEMHKGQALMRDIVEEIEIPCNSGKEDGIPDATEKLWFNGQVDQFISDQCMQVLEAYLDKYMCWTYEYRYTGTKMLRYPNFSHSPVHYDDELMNKSGLEQGYARPITLVVYLNEGFHDGWTVFEDQKAMVAPKRGRVVVFPASYMYPHKTTPSHGSVERYILLPFFIKAGLNAKIAGSQAKKEFNKRYRKDFDKNLKSS